VLPGTAAAAAAAVLPLLPAAQQHCIRYGLVLPVLPGTAAATGACAVRFPCKLQSHSSSHNDEMIRHRFMFRVSLPPTHSDSALVMCIE
jgi:hypothetical protein